MLEMRMRPPANQSTHLSPAEAGRRTTGFAALLLMLHVICSSVLVSGLSRAQANFGELRDKASAELASGKGVSVATIRAIGKVKQPQARRLLADIVAAAKQDAEKAAALVELARFEHRDLLKVFDKEFAAATVKAIADAAAAGLALQEHAGLEKLVAAATHDRKVVRAAAAQALTGALRKNGTVLPYLLDFTARTVPDERAQPLIALRGRAASPDMVELFAKLALEVPEAPRCEALRLHAEGAAPKLTRELVAKVEASTAGKKRSSALESALLHPRTASIDDTNVEAYLQDSVEVIDRLAVELRRIDGHASTRDRVAAVLGKVVARHEGAVERLIACEVLAFLRGSEADSALVRALDDETTAVALLAIREVARRKLDGAEPRLRKLFEGQHEELQLEALLALHAMEKVRNKTAWPQELRAVLEDGKRVGLRCAAIDCLREVRDEKALPLVNACAKAPEWQLRSAAFRFLEDIADKESMSILVERLQVEEGRLAGECMAALMQQSGKDFPKPVYWKRWWDTEQELWKPREVKAVATGSKKGKKHADDERPARSKASALTYYNIPITSNAASFIIDTSGSMAAKAGTAREPKIDAAKQALIQVLGQCEADRNFNIVPFSTGPRPWQNELRPMDDRYRNQAIAFTRTLRAAGGTNIHDALRHAFDDPRVDTIYLLSDGQPSGGKIDDPNRLADAVATWNRERRIVIHTIAFGQDHPFLQRIAKESGGHYVRYL